MTIDFTDISSILTGISSIIIPVWIFVLLLSIILSMLFNAFGKGRL